MQIVLAFIMAVILVTTPPSTEITVGGSEQIQEQNIEVEEEITDEIEEKAEEETKEEFEEKPEEEVNENILPTLPSGDTSFKSWMDYTAITNKQSPQWKLQEQAYTDENGLRKVDEYYCVAVGTGLSKGIGTKLIVTLDTGIEIPVIVADHKANRHTDATNTYMAMNNGRINVVEFVVEYSRLAEKTKLMGDVSYVPGGQFKGQVVEIKGVE